MHPCMIQKFAEKPAPAGCVNYKEGHHRQQHCLSQHFSCWYCPKYTPSIVIQSYNGCQQTHEGLPPARWGINRNWGWLPSWDHTILYVMQATPVTDGYALSMKLALPYAQCCNISDSFLQTQATTKIKYWHRAPVSLTSGNNGTDLLQAMSGSICWIMHV